MDLADVWVKNHARYTCLGISQMLPFFR